MSPVRTRSPWQRRGQIRPVAHAVLPGPTALAGRTDFGLDEYEELAQTMACLKSEVILTINDHPDMRRLFDRFDGKTVPIRYTIGKGDGVARRERICTAGAG